MQFLAAHRHRSVPRDELIMAVWPDTDEDGGRHRLHQAVYELRRTLHSVDPGRSPVVCGDGGYRLDDELSVWVDTEEFDDLGSAASRCLTARRPPPAHARLRERRLSPPGALTRPSRTAHRAGS